MFALLAAREKVSIETAARIARYAFYAKVAARRRCRTIFLGHHADDLVETFLINLFRGAGAAGLSSLREISSHQVGKTKLMVVRPLLAVWRKRDRRIHRRRESDPFREDQTNKDLGPLRNRIRHQVIPYLERVFGRNIRQSIWRAAMIAAEENDWINSLIDEQVTLCHRTFSSKTARPANRGAAPRLAKMAPPARSRRCRL